MVAPSILNMMLLTGLWATALKPQVWRYSHRHLFGGRSDHIWTGGWSWAGDPIWIRLRTGGHVYLVYQEVTKP